jgi:rRNA biogenesis protein RRP5
MAPIKRKNDPTNDSFVRSKKVGQNDSRPVKRLRQDESTSETTKPETTKSSSSHTQIYVPKIARAREEEAAFPRGGASVLTPLEHKQIQIDATRDVLFEQQSASKKKGTEDGDLNGSVAPGEAIQKKRRSKSKGKADTEKKDAEEEVVRIEGLSYKVIDALSYKRLIADI